MGAANLDGDSRQRAIHLAAIFEAVVEDVHFMVDAAYGALEDRPWPRQPRVALTGGHAGLRWWCELKRSRQLVASDAEVFIAGQLARALPCALGEAGALCALLDSIRHSLEQILLV